jgi:hypothetical protein
MSRKDGGRISGPFIPLLLSTIDSPAWCELSHGAQYLYIALKCKSSNHGNRAYLSTREAARRLKASRQKIREWYAELEHYGFIVMISAGCLGSDGYGKAPLWRLTEKGNTSKQSHDGLFEAPTQDFLKWDGTLFDPKPYRDKRGRTEWDDTKKQNPGHPVQSRVVTPYDPPLVTPYDPGKAEGGHPVRSICVIEGGHPVQSITRLTTIPSSAPASDPRLTALDATEKRLKQARRPNGQRD